MTDIYTFLSDQNIAYERFDHPAVYTCEEAERLCPKMPGVATKNLFLRDKDGQRHFLVLVGYDKNVNLKKLKALLGVSKLSFGSPERLKKYLGVEPGSVTLLGLLHDAAHAVEVIFDTNLSSKALQCHPLVNTATLVIESSGVQRFLEATGHAYRFLEVPERG